jgi:predicted nucleic acid-binding protein
LNWLLDTDVICQPAKRQGDARVIAWLHQERDRCFTSAIVIAQLAYWVRSKEGVQSVQGTASGLKQHKAGDAQGGTVFQEIYLAGSPAAAASLAENYVGLPY